MNNMELIIEKCVECGNGKLRGRPHVCWNKKKYTLSVERKENICYLCGKKVMRKQKRKKVTCFDCKEIQQKEWQRQWRLKMKSKPKEVQTYPYKPFTHVRKKVPKEIRDEIEIMKNIIQKALHK